MSKARTSPIRTGLVHLALIGYTLIAIFPVFLTIINSFKDRNAIFREPMREGGLTSRRWPRWIGPDLSGENSWELRLPTTFTLGAFVVLWAGVACWRWQRRRARRRELPAAPP